MSFPETASTKPDHSRASAESLPAVAPPTATFILQLFLIPLLIVTIVVVLWLLFSWVALMGRDNAADLAAAIERGDSASWQRAYELADLLRSSDPRYDALRRDAKLAAGLAKFLDRDLAEPVSRQEDQPHLARQPGSSSASQAPPGSDYRARIMRRMYLCRALGSFAVQDGLPVLLKAAALERDPVEVEVRFSALEAIATLADNCGPGALRQNPTVLETLLAASREAADDISHPKKSIDGEPTLYRPHSELRAVAAYALGVVGGEQATERLRQMLHDPYPNARFNAATGLARYGDAQCISVLREMLDPVNELAIKDEANPNDQAKKRTTVLLNGIKATVQLAAANTGGDLAPLNVALDHLAHSSLESVTVDRNKVKSAAVEAQRLIDTKGQ